MKTKYRLYHELNPGAGRNYYHDWKIIAFLRAIPLLWNGYRVRITTNEPYTNDQPD